MMPENLPQKIRKILKNILEHGNEVHKQGLDHSTAGGRIAVGESIKEWPVAEFVSSSDLFSSRDWHDSINLESGSESAGTAGMKKADCI